MKISISIILFLSVALTLISDAHTQTSLEQAKKSNGMNIENLKIPPVNAFELIQNIKYYAENELFLDESFFEKHNLLQFANARSLEELGPDKNYFLIRNMNIDGVGIAMDVIRRNTEEKKTTGLALNFSSEGITVDYLIENFGPIKKIEDPYKNDNPIHPRPVLKRSHQYGNLELFQVIEKNKTITEIQSLLSSNGSVFRFNIVQTREK